MFNVQQQTAIRAHRVSDIVVANPEPRISLYCDGVAIPVAGRLNRRVQMHHYSLHVYVDVSQQDRFRNVGCQRVVDENLSTDHWIGP